MLTSLMARLRCASGWERSHVPAFVYFFQMLYPFAWVNRCEDATARRGGRLHAGEGRRARDRPAASRASATRSLTTARSPRR